MVIEAERKLVKIDADSHFFPQGDFGDVEGVVKEHLGQGYSQEAFEMLLRDAQVFTDPNARRGGFRATQAGQAVGAQTPAARQSGPVGHGIAEHRVKLLPETGFDMQVLIPDGIFANPFGSPVKPDWPMSLRLAICAAFNNATAAAQKAFPNQLIGTAVVPFGGDVEASSREATRAVKQLGLKALTINGNWGGRNYDSIDLYPFWKTVNDLGVPLYVHHNPFSCSVNDHLPTTYTIGWERLRRLHISNYLGFAFEYMVGMASLTLGGLLKEFPNLKFVFFEAGGSWLPWVMYTLDRVYRVERQCARCEREPSEHIRESCFVAVEPDEEPIVQAVAAIGSGNFVLGSDYPHPPSTYPTTASGIEEMPGLSEAAKADILGRNMQNIFGIG